MNSFESSSTQRTSESPSAGETIVNMMLMIGFWEEGNVSEEQASFLADKLLERSNIIG